MTLHKPLRRVYVQSYLLGIVDHSQYLKRIGEVAYKLALPEGCRVHPIFHVGRLKRKLGDDDNLIGDEVLVELIEPLLYLMNLKRSWIYKKKEQDIPYFKNV